MKISLKKPAFFIWIAIVAILMNALAPSMSQVINASRNGELSLLDICFSPVSKNSKASLQARSDSGSDSQTTVHCPYCLPHAGMVGLPPSKQLDVAVVLGHDVFPSLFYQSHTPLFSWVAAAPRGPPALS